MRKYLNARLADVDTEAIFHGSKSGASTFVIQQYVSREGKFHFCGRFFCDTRNGKREGWRKRHDGKIRHGAKCIGHRERPVVGADDGHRMDISLAPLGSGGVTRRQISRGDRTSSEITCEPRPVDSSRALWSLSTTTAQLSSSKH